MTDGPYFILAWELKQTYNILALRMFENQNL